MRRITLTEFQTQYGIELAVDERDALHRLHPGIRIEPTPGSQDRYNLTADQHIGVVSLPHVVVEVRPKVPMASVLFLISYACNLISWFTQQPRFDHDSGMTEILALMFARSVEHTTRRGLLNGYSTRDETLIAPRGRLDFEEQFRRQKGAALPVAVRHDVFTADVVENRVLLAALDVLRRMPLRSPLARRELIRAEHLFGAVTLQRFRQGEIPSIVFTRLNEHYRPALSLATVVLRSATLEFAAGNAHGVAFLVDMNRAFEAFIRTALQYFLRLMGRRLADRAPMLALDEAGRVPLRPDLCVLEGQRIVWVGDAKYKRLPAGGYENADLYQMLAYTVALDLQHGTLIYAADDGFPSGEHVVVRAGKRLRVIALDLAAPPARILQQLNRIAESITVERGMTFLNTQ